MANNAVEVDIKKLLEAGAHFGHKTSRWHPKMAPFIHSKRNGSHIIDLTQTVAALDSALEFITQTASQGRQILFVGTKRQSKDIVKALAEATKMPYVNERWLGGLLTNQKTIGGRIKHLKDLEANMASGDLSAKYNKLEIQRYQEEIDHMNYLYGGVKEMASRVGAVFMFDITHEHTAHKEATKLGLKTIGIVDTNADPSLIDFPIPSNDDAIKTLQLIADYVQQAIELGRSKIKAPVVDKTEVAESPAEKSEKA